MRKSLFSKIFITQIVAALTVVILIVPTMFVLVGEYFVSIQKDDIYQDASRVATLAIQISDMKGNKATQEFFRNGIEFAGQQSTIIVLDADGAVFAAPKSVPGVNLEAMSEEFISIAKEGRGFVRLYEENDMFYEQTIAAVVPMFKKNILTEKREFIGASVALRSTPQIREIQFIIMGITLRSQAVAWLVALIVAFVITRQITKPVKKMRDAAKSIASGNFNTRIVTNSKDEIGELAQSFNSMTQSLSELENMRTSFLSDVSHELRTPMTIISGFVEGILDGTIAQSEQEKYLEIVLKEVKRLSRLVSDLLEATRLEQGKVKLTKTDFDMNRLVTESVIAYEQQLTDKVIDVSLNLDEKECFAFADKDALKRVLINLIDNSIKFTPEKGSIVVSTQHIPGKVKVSVENSGPGISEDDLRHIWERFYKSDKSRSMDKKGVGLGLHIVKTIISQHNGEIFAESEEGKFARFTFVIDEGHGNDVSYEKEG